MTRDSERNTNRERARSAFARFLDTPLEEALAPRGRGSPQESALALFRDMAATVPAYRAFLRQRGLDPAAVNTAEDFRRLPLITRDNYLHKHPLPMLCRGGELTACDMMAVSSGSTGEPGFWPRFVSDEYAIALRFEQVFRDSFAAHERRTLAVVCFTLGTWVGGMFTQACLRHLAAKGYPLTVITPGNNKEEIFRVVSRLAPHFDQTVLLGYPPFIKDVIDSGRARSVDWARYAIRMVFAGEVFSEEWRELVLARAGCTDPLRDAASLYGTADGGVLGNETPLSIAIRRWFAQHPQQARERFGASRLPTLVQYDPYSRYFETHEGTLLFSGDNGVPLLRYHISDEGGLIGFKEMREYLGRHDCDPLAGLGATARELPFVYVFGRSHFVLSYFGANIYPENVSIGLEHPQVRDWVTGKFVMQVMEDADRNEHLGVTVELAPGEAQSGARRTLAAESILRELRRLNSEFAHYVPAEYQAPRVTLKPAGDPEWFPPGVKHRYSRR